MGGGVPQPNYCVGLGTFLALNDVELYVIALFQCFVAVQLYCRVVDEHIGTVFTPDESVALGVVKPLHFAFVLSHRLLPFLRFLEMAESEGVRGDARRMKVMTRKTRERLINFSESEFTK
jgi:hypothetical protein